MSKQVTIQLIQSPTNPWNVNEPENSIWKFGLQCFFHAAFWASVLTRPAWAKSNCTAVLQAPLQLDGQTWLRTSVTGDSSRGVTPFWPNASLMSCSIVCWNKQKTVNKVCLCDRAEPVISATVITQNTVNQKDNYEGRVFLFCSSGGREGWPQATWLWASLGAYHLQFEVVSSWLVKGHSFEEVGADLYRDSRKFTLDGLRHGLNPARLLGLRITAAALHTHACKTYYFLD